MTRLPAKEAAAELTESEPEWAVTIVCNDSDYFNRHRRVVADRLAEAGIAVQVLAGGDEGRIEAPYKWAFRHVEIDRFRFRPIADIRLFSTILAHLFRKRPDVLHLITLKPLVVCGPAGVIGRILFGAPRKIVIMIAGLGRLMSPSSEMRGRHSLARSAVQAIVGWLGKRRNVHFVFETESDRSVWITQGLVSQKNSEVVPGAGVNADEYYPRASPRQSGPLQILYATRLLPAKGFDVYLDTARHFSGNMEVEFLVAGLSGEHDRDVVQFNELTDDLPIRFLGEVSDMPPLLRSVDLVCLPSRYGEGIPRILIEAAACGVPAIVSDLPGCLQIVENDATGIVIPVAPKLELVTSTIAAVERYLANPELLATHGAAAHRKFISGKFEQKNIVARFMELLTR